MKVPVKDFKNFEKIAGVYKAISHPVRLAILENFQIHRSKHLTVKSIYQRLGMDQPVASHHLGILKRAGLLQREIKNGMTYYGIRPEHPLMNDILSSLKKAIEPNQKSLKKKKK